MSLYWAHQARQAVQCRSLKVDRTGECLVPPSLVSPDLQVFIATNSKKEIFKHWTAMQKCLLCTLSIYDVLSSEGMSLLPTLWDQCVSRWGSFEPSESFWISSAADWYVIFTVRLKGWGPWGTACLHVTICSWPEGTGCLQVDTYSLSF